MQSGNNEAEDCYYYLQSSCRKGDECKYRHNPEAKANPTLCPTWASTRRCTLDCPMRHSTYHLQKRKSDDFCYFESTEQGCTKPGCEFRHREKRSQLSMDFFAKIESENKMIQNYIDNVNDEIRSIEDCIQSLN